MLIYTNIVTITQCQQIRHAALPSLSCCQELAEQQKLFLG